MAKEKRGRPTKKIIKPISKLPFEIMLDFAMGKQERHQKDKKVVSTLKKEPNNE